MFNRTSRREMLKASAMAIASVVEPNELCPEYIIPSAFNEKVSERVAQAVVDVVNDPKMAQTPIYFEF